MNVLRIIIGLIIGWFILVVLSVLGIIGLLASFVRGFFQSAMNNGAAQSRQYGAQQAAQQDAQKGALDMARCQYCGVFTSGICNNPQCSGQ